MALAEARTDAALVLRLRERDRSAWAELYEAYASRLYGFAYKLTGSGHDAADLVQETFARVLPRLDRLNPERVDLAGYLFTTTRNLFLKGAERGKRQEPVAEVPEPDAPAVLDESPEGSALLTSQQEEVRLATARLAPRQRLVLALRELEDCSYAEIGAIVGLNENAVAQLIARARGNLRQELRLAQVAPESLPAECRAFLPLLSQHLDAQLKGAQRERVLAHLEECERCQQALAEMQEAGRRYRALVPPLLWLPEVKERIDELLSARRYWQGPSPWARVAPARLGLTGRLLAAAGAAVILALLGFGGALHGSGWVVGDEPVALPSPSTSEGMTTATAKPVTTTKKAGKKRTRANPVVSAAAVSPPSPPTRRQPSSSPPRQKPPKQTNDPAPPVTTTPPPATTPPTTSTEEPPATTTAPPPATTAPPALPDLVIVRVTSTSITIANVGNASSGLFAVRIGKTTYRFAGLAAGSSVARDLSCAESERQVIVDVLGQVSELDEQNNSGSIPAAVC